MSDATPVPTEVPGETRVPDLDGRRVLCVTALADSVKGAQQRAYDVLRGISFDGAQFRRDIGHRAAKG